MKTRSYNKSEILNFSDLTEAQQTEILDTMEPEQAQEDSFVLFHHTYKGERNKVPLPLSMFMRINNNMRYNSTRWHGVYSTSAFSAYYIRLSESGDMALVAECYS